MCAYLLGELQNFSSLLSNHREENVESHQKKDTLYSRVKERHQPDSRKVKSRLESNSIPTGDTRKG